MIQSNLLSKTDTIIALVLPFVLLLTMALDKMSLGLPVVLVLSLIRIHKVEVVFPAYWASSLSSMFMGIGSSETTVGRYLTLVVIVSLVFNLFVNKKGLNKGSLSMLLVLGVYSFFSALFSPSGSLVIFVIVFQELLLFTFLINAVVDYKALIQLLSVTAIMVVAYFAKLAVDNAAFMFVSSFGDEEGINSNNLAMLVAQCSAILISYFFYTKGITKRAVTAFFIGLSFLIILATGSRTTLIAITTALVATLIYVFANPVVKINFFVKLLIIIGIITFGIMVSNEIFSQESYFTRRFSADDVVDTGGTGRLDCIKIIMSKIFPDHFLFGSGLGANNVMILGKPYGLQYPAHNFIIDPLSQLGIVGFILFWSFLLPRLIRIFSLIKMRYNIELLASLFFIVPLIAAIINGIGETVFFEKFFWNDLALCYLGYLYAIRTTSNGQISNITK